MDCLLGLCECCELSTPCDRHLCEPCGMCKGCGVGVNDEAKPCNLLETCRSWEPWEVGNWLIQNGIPEELAIKVCRSLDMIPEPICGCYNGSAEDD